MERVRRVELDRFERDREKNTCRLPIRDRRLFFHILLHNDGGALRRKPPSVAERKPHALVNAEESSLSMSRSLRYKADDSFFKDRINRACCNKEKKKVQKETIF